MKNLFFRVVLGLNFIITLVLCLALINNTKQADLTNSVLKVRGLVVVDSLGVERVIIGSPLPDPTFHGYRFPRGGEEGGISGILLFDSEGQERSGYVTDDYYGNVFLTLDSKTQQSALFIANPEGPSALQLWGRNGNKISFLTSDDDIEVLTIKNGKIVKLITDE
jgi:hypothetical protein